MVLRDTGSTTCVVVIFGQTRANGRIMCTLIDRLVIRYPTAVVELDTPYYKRTTKVLCMETLVQDIQYNYW